MMGIPYRYGIETLPINRNRNVKHKTETETERTPQKKRKKKFETSAFGGASRVVFSDATFPASRRWKRCKGLLREDAGYSLPRYPTAPRWRGAHNE